MKRELARTCTKALIVIIGFLITNGWCQKITSDDRDAALVMLRELSGDVKKHYYDPQLHGVNWDAKVEEMRQRIKATDSIDVALSAVAATLDTLNDSHTFFLPPTYSIHHDYGWQTQMVGDRCFVLRVRPGSDAENMGVKAGDELLALNGFTPDREHFRKLAYGFNRLHPQTALRLDLRDPAGKRRQADVATAITTRRQFFNAHLEMAVQAQNAKYFGRARFAETSDDVGVLKFPRFFFTESEVDGMIGKARKHKALVLDLRSNGGGSSETLKYLTAGFFEKEVKIADRIGRSELKPLIAKPHGHPFTGKLVVLVDSGSASTAELFARLVQIEKRGTVLGDRSSGSVMEAKFYSYRCGVGTALFYGAEITDADLVMTDGMSLEHKGVLPDEIILPSAGDLANGRDPVLARAVEAAGGKLSPEEAGKLLPYEWPDL
jgi:C-terminal processing protease CtpA/Prc